MSRSQAIKKAQSEINDLANDPFVVAQRLSNWYNEVRAKGLPHNVYLSPLATKPQALGFTLFALMEGLSGPISMIYPFCETHSAETGVGLARAWMYTVELNLT